MEGTNTWLQTRARLNKRINSICPNCPLCTTDNGDHDHLFINCNFSRHVWATIPDISPVNDNTRLGLLEWLHKLDDSGKEKLASLSKAFLFCCWQI